MSPTVVGEATARGRSNEWAAGAPAISAEAERPYAGRRCYRRVDVPDRGPLDPAGPRATRPHDRRPARRAARLVPPPASGGPRVAYDRPRRDAPREGDARDALRDPAVAHGRQC